MRWGEVGWGGARRGRAGWGRMGSDRLTGRAPKTISHAASPNTRYEISELFAEFRRVDPRVEQCRERLRGPSACAVRHALHVEVGQGVAGMTAILRDRFHTRMRATQRLGCA